jgi:hypothetical protein
MLFRADGCFLVHLRKCPHDTKMKKVKIIIRGLGHFNVCASSMSIFSGKPGVRFCFLILDAYFAGGPTSCFKASGERARR